MIDAQHAPVPTEIARTHSGLITAFSFHLVKPGLVAVAHGRSLNKVEDLRHIADYKGDPVNLENAVLKSRPCNFPSNAGDQTEVPTKPS